MGQGLVETSSSSTLVMHFKKLPVLWLFLSLTLLFDKYHRCRSVLHFYNIYTSGAALVFETL